MNPRVLVFRGGAIGDFVLTLPVFAALKARYPNGFLHLVGPKRVICLATGWADQIHSIDDRGLASFFINSGILPEEWVDTMQKADVVLSYLHDPTSEFRRNVQICSKARYIQGGYRPDDCPAMHATQYLLRPLEALGITQPDPCPKLSLSGSMSDTWVEGAPSVLAIHPGSGSERKNWPETRWIELIDRLAQCSDWHVLLVGGEAEQRRLPRLAARISSGRCHVALSLPLNDLVRKLARVDYYVGHDSGITHIAAALGLAGCVLWGESNLKVWGPLNQQFTVLKNDRGLENLEVDRVWQVIAQSMSPKTLVDSGAK